MNVVILMMKMRSTSGRTYRIKEKGLAAYEQEVARLQQYVRDEGNTLLYEMRRMYENKEKL